MPANQDSVKFIHGRKKTRGELRLPQLHFIFIDDWKDKVGKEALWAWLEFYTWADRSNQNREYDSIPRSMGQVQKRLGVGKATFYNKIIRPLWNYGFIDLQEIEIDEIKGNNPVNIIVYEYPNNDPNSMTKPIEKIRDYDTDYQTATREKAKKGGRPKKGSSGRELPPSSHTELPLVPVENYPSSGRELNNVSNQSNVLKFLNNDLNISINLDDWLDSLKHRKIDGLTEKIKSLSDVYLEMRNIEGFNNDLFIIVANRVLETKVKRNFKGLLRKSILNEINERKQAMQNRWASGVGVPEYIQKQIERDRHEEKQREIEQLRGSKVDQEELDRLIAELEGLE